MRQVHVPERAEPLRARRRRRLQGVRSRGVRRAAGLDLNSTIRDNILFGTPYDAAKYARCVKASQLQTDFEILPDKDATIIGERGVTLSGGQKQRVAIARAVYAAADVYLMDDPLSAVDNHVGHALFEQVLSHDGVLRNAARVLATNALQYLPGRTAWWWSTRRSSPRWARTTRS